MSLNAPTLEKFYGDDITIYTMTSSPHRGPVRAVQLYSYARACSRGLFSHECYLSHTVTTPSEILIEKWYICTLCLGGGSATVGT